MHERGKIENRARAQQIRDFSGLRYNKITPTDIDGLIDFQDKCFIVFELKYGDASVPDGQKLAIQRVVDIIHETKRTSIGLIGRHEHHDVNEEIDCANAVVVEYRWLYDWHVPKSTITIGEAIDKVTEGIL